MTREKPTVYALGIDLGTTYTAAAVWRGGRAEICALGTRSAAVPSVVLVRADGSVLTGEAAVRRAVAEPDRVAREFKRRLGDSTPVLLGGSPFSAEALTARLLSAVHSTVVDREGGAPDEVCVSHPANWGPFKTDLLRQAVTLAGLRGRVTYTTEPEAAAISYARQERLAPGETIAVYDLGGGTFDAAVLRRTETGFTILGQPEGIERLGGIDIDAAVFAHVARTVGAPLTDLDEDDPAAIAAVARLRAECTDAKEALSSDTDTTIPVLLPHYTSEVRLTRAELESMVRPPLYDSIEVLKRALHSANVTPDNLAAVLLVGGSSRMPLVAQLVGAELGRPVAVDAHPKHAIALGAAWLASGTTLPAEPAPATQFVVVSSLPPTPPPASLPPRTPTAPPASHPVRPPAAPPASHPVRPPAAPPATPSMTPPTRPPASDRGPILQPPVPNPTRPGYPQSSNDPPLGTYPTIPAGYRTPAPGPHPPTSNRPMLGLPADAAPSSRRSRWLLPTLAAVATLLLVTLLAVWQLSRRSGDTPNPGQATTAGSGLGSSAAANLPPTGSTSPSTVRLSGTGAPTAGARTVELKVIINGSGAVNGPLSCSGSCRTEVRQGQTLHLTARPASGFTFSEWAGCTSTNGSECTISANHATTVTVTFSPPASGSTTSSSSARTSATTSGTSPSRSTTSTSRTSTSTPSKVPSVRLYNPTQNTLDIDWTPASGATRYQLSWVESGSDGRTWNGVPPAYTDYQNGPVTLVNLRPSHTYTVTVTPFNGSVAGAGTTSTGTTAAETTSS